MKKIPHFIPSIQFSAFSALDASRRVDCTRRKPLFKPRPTVVLTINSNRFNYSCQTEGSSGVDSFNRWTEAKIAKRHRHKLQWAVSTDTVDDQNFQRRPTERGCPRTTILINLNNRTLSHLSDVCTSAVGDSRRQEPPKTQRGTGAKSPQDSLSQEICHDAILSGSVTDAITCGECCTSISRKE